MIELRVLCMRTEGVLPVVEQRAGKQAHVPHNEDWPSLCAANIGTWHRVLFTELLRQWESGSASMRRLRGSHESTDPDHVRLRPKHMPYQSAVHFAEVQRSEELRTALHAAITGIVSWSLDTDVDLCFPLRMNPPEINVSSIALSMVHGGKLRVWWWWW